MSRAFVYLALASLSGSLCMPPSRHVNAGATVVPPIGHDDSIARTARDTLTAADSAWADSVLATLSLRDKAAQMLWPIVLADYVSTRSDRWRRISSWFTDQHIGGVVISVGAPLELAAKVNSMQRVSPLPLLVAADLEAGAGFRARSYFVPNGIDLGGATQFPSQMALGATGDTLLAYQQGTITAEEGRALGIEIAFAPVLDVNNNPDNPVINVRSLGEDPHAVAALGSALVRGMQDHGMVATGKHFPGHGDTDVNSHLGLAVVRASRNRLDTLELVPFRAAIAGGLDAIMSFHGILPSLDSSGVPATLSHATLTGLLRDQLGFRGMVVSDAMDMEGVLAQFGSPEATKRAVAAGIDVLIFPVDISQSIDAIVAGVREGRYPESRITESARRILRMKARLGLQRNRFVVLDSVRNIVGDEAHVAVARTIAERSITLVQDAQHLVPLGKQARAWSITYARRTELSAGTTFDGELRRTIPGLQTRFITSGIDDALMLPFADSIAAGDLVIVSAYPSQLAQAATTLTLPLLDDFVRRVVARKARVMVVSFASPYLLREMPGSVSYMIAWDGVPIEQLAAARALSGAAPISGRLPISIPPFAKRGDGIFHDTTSSH